MTATRSKNTLGNYTLEQRDYSLARNYDSYIHSQYGQAYTTALPCLGFNPSHMPRGTFSYNPVEIESALFGINSTNLVAPRAPLKPDLKTIPTIAYFETLKLQMPKPLVMENGQRPFPVPN
jgi:hypothetical protein